MPNQNSIFCHDKYTALLSNILWFRSNSQSCTLFFINSLNSINLLSTLSRGGLSNFICSISLLLKNSNAQNITNIIRATEDVIVEYWFNTGNAKARFIRFSAIPTKLTTKSEALLRILSGV